MTMTIYDQLEPSHVTSLKKARLLQSLCRNHLSLCQHIVTYHLYIHGAWTASFGVSLCRQNSLANKNKLFKYYEQQCFHYTGWQNYQNLLNAILQCTVAIQQYTTCYSICTQYTMCICCHIAQAYIRLILTCVMLLKDGKWNQSCNTAHLLTGNSPLLKILFLR